MKKYLTIVASALLMFAGANLYAQTAQDNLDKAKASLNDAQKHYDKVAKVENRKIDASKDKISDLKLKIDKDNLAINEANALIKQKQQTLKLKKDAYNAEKKALAADGGLSKADKLQLKEREGEVKAIANDIKNDQNSIKTLKSGISDKKNAIKREQNSINKSKAEIAAAKKELSTAKQGVKDSKKAVSAEKKAAAAEAKVAAAEKKAAEKAEQAATAEAKQAAKESQSAADAAVQAAQAKADAAEASAAAAAAEAVVAQAELAKAEAAKAAAEASAKFIADAFANADVQLRQLIAASEADTLAKNLPAGSFWYMYQYSADEFWAEKAAKYTEALGDLQGIAEDHNLGLIVNSAFGNGLKLKGNEAYKDAILNAAKLPGAKLSESDNLMNVELLFNAAAISADTALFQAAVAYADSSLKNPADTALSLGLSQLLYGYAVAYRYTSDQKYLDKAESIAVLPVIDAELPAYAPVLASALYEIYGFTKKAEYKEQADKLVLGLSADYYYLEALLRKKAIENL